MGSVLDFSVNYGCMAYRWCGAGPLSAGGWWRTVRPPRLCAAAPAPIATRKYPTSRSPVNSGHDVTIGWNKCARETDSRHLLITGKTCLW